MSKSRGEGLPIRRVFISHVDSYVGRNIGEYLSQCVVGESTEPLDLEEEEEGEEQDGFSQAREGTYQVVGSLSQTQQQPPPFVLETVQASSREELKSFLLGCDIIVYDIRETADLLDEAAWVHSALHSEIENFKDPKIFILISSFMTWTLTKPVDPDDPEVPFTEDDHRKRRPHPAFKDHVALEKLVMKLGKTSKKKFIGYVVSSGLPYGMGEEPFHFIFKTAWLGELPAVPVIERGTNVLPTIHIRDLAGVIQNIADHKPKTRYILAVDEGKHTQLEIAQAISKRLGTGRISHISKQEAMSNKDCLPHHVEQLLLDVCAEAVFVKEELNVRWVAEAGLLANLERVVREFRATRKLQPIKICILGPPVTGKSTVAQMLCKHYKIHHVNMKDVITEALTKLERIVGSAGRKEETEWHEDDVEAFTEDVQEAQDFLEALRENMLQNEGRLEDSYLVRLYKEKLSSPPCQNQGFVLDGFPKTFAQAVQLFGVEDEEDGEELNKRKVPLFDKSIIPELVVSLDAEDDVVLHRAMALPECAVREADLTEERVRRRLAEFHALRSEDDTVLDYFDELEIHPDHIDVSVCEVAQIKRRIRKLIGEPRNYGPSAEEQLELAQRAEVKRREREARRRVDQLLMDAQQAAQRLCQEEEWRACWEEVKRQEREAMGARHLPLRNYLMKYVMPPLAQGLDECCKVKPHDPIDFVAEYLLQYNCDKE